MLRRLSTLLPIIFLLASSSCSLDKMASDITAKIFEKGSPVMEEGDDPEVSENAALTMLKMTEVFYHHNPDNEIYGTLLAKSYGNYAYGFLENHILWNKGRDDAAYQKYVKRAKLFYTHGKNYGLKMLNKNSRFEKAVTSDMTDLEAALKKFDGDDVPALFWTAFCWGSYINLSKDDPVAITDLGKVELMMKRVLELEEGFFNSGPNLFYGVYYASRPPMLGGSPARAKIHFDNAIRQTKGKFFMVSVNYAQFYAVQTQDKDLFVKLLRDVLNTDANVFPEQRLANLLAQDRARILLTKANEYF